MPEQQQSQGLNPAELKEVVFRAVTGTAESPTASEPVKNKAGRLRGKLNEKPGVPGVKDMYTLVKKEVELPREEKIIKAVEDHIGWKKDKEGKIIPEEIEKSLFNSAKKDSEIISKYIREGYEGLNGNERKKVCDEIERIYDSSTGENEFWSKLSPEEKRNHIERILKDAKYRDGVIGVFKKLLEAPNDSKSVQEAEAKLQAIEKQKDSKSKELSNIKRELKEIEFEIEEFSVKKSDGDKGSYYQEIKDLQKKVSDGAVGFELMTEYYKEIDKELAPLYEFQSKEIGRYDVSKFTDENAPGWFKRIKELQSQKMKIKNEMITTQQQIIRLNELNKSKAEAFQERQRLEGERNKLEAEVEAADVESQKAKAEFKDAKEKRYDEEFDFGSKLNNVFYEAAYTHQEEKFQEAAKAMIALNEEDMKKTGDLARQKISGGLNSRWTRFVKKKEGGFLGIGAKEVETIVVKKYAVMSDLNTFVNGDGPNAVLKDILMQPPNNFSSQDADIKLKDENFVKEMQPKVVDQLLSIAGRENFIKGEMMLKIADTEWGKARIARVFDKNPGVKGSFGGRANTPEEMAQVFVNSRRDVVDDRGKNSFLEALMLIFAGGAMVGMESLLSEDVARALKGS